MKKTSKKSRATIPLTQDESLETLPLIMTMAGIAELTNLAS